MDTQEPTLRHGDEGIDGWVEYLQGLLIIEGHNTVTKNGSFDDATLEAVQQYQLHNGLLADGVVGNQTWASLRHGDAQMAGTDGREAGTYVEDKREARWVWDEEIVHHDATADELLFVAVNVGSAELDASTLANATCRITPPGGDAFVMELVPRNENGSTPTEIGKRFFYVASNVNSIPAGRYTAEAWLPDELSGDRSESHFEIAAR
jgi:peptidoglycan hydrolase-like protein with peptidoglycan-binding domain